MEGTPQNQNVQSVPSVLTQNTETRQAPEAVMDGNGEAREGKLIKSPLVGTFMRLLQKTQSLLWQWETE